jgi:hypothetical protein
MESDSENNSFVQIFDTFTEKSLDFNSEKYAKPNDMNFLPKDLEQNNFFNDNENKPTSCDSNNIFEENSKENLFENEKSIEIINYDDEFNKYNSNEILEIKSNKIHFGSIIIKKLYNAKKEYLFKKMFTLITKILIEKFNKEEKILKKVKLISEYNYDNYKIYLNKKIKELLSKNEKNKKKINLLETEPKFKEILNMKLNDLINKNKKALNEKYEKFFNNYFLIYFKGANSFNYLGSIEKLINEININKGNNKNKKD